MQKELFDCFAKGRLTVAGRLPALAVGPWKEHKDFPGVFLKNLVMPELTEGLLSCHLVRIEAGAGSAGTPTARAWNCMKLSGEVACA